MSYPDIKYLFEPRSVAIIGASQHKGKIGFTLVDNIIAGGYRGEVYPVNPKGGEILGRPVYQTVQDIEGEVDAACIAVPSKFTFEAVKDCAAKGVKHLVVITSGFSEVGNLEEERQITAYAREHGMRILGPNIFGIYSAKAAINATFGPKDIKPGNVAIITQSGALGIAMIGKTKAENIGLSAIVSDGNKSDIDETDLLEYLVNQNETKVILLYIEGVTHGDRLVNLLKTATQKKPVIAIKAGRSKRGAMAAASHTGSLAGADEIFSDVMRQCGVIRAETLKEALDWCKYLSDSPTPKGENSVIITNGGGIGVLAPDACEKYGVTLYDDMETLRNTFSDVVPEFGSMKNPVDLTGQASIEYYERALDAVFKNENYHSVICLGCETAAFDPEKISLSIEKIHSDYKPVKPAVYSFVGGEELENRFSRIKSRGVPVFMDVDEAVSCLGALYKNYHNVTSKTEVIEQDKLDAFGIDGAAIKPVLEQVREDKRQFLILNEAEAVMRAAGIRMPQSYIARNLQESVKFAEKIGYPVVMKVVSKDIIHKSDWGGVLLNLENQDEVMDAYQAIIHNCKRHNPRARIEGIEVSEMVKTGTEMIIGARRDASFGPIVMCGLGGVYVEVMKDVSFRAFPLGRQEAFKMISEIKAYPLLLGVRGEAKKDIQGVVETILKIGAVLYHFKEISDIEINPLIVYGEGEGSKALDARILISKS